MPWITSLRQICTVTFDRTFDRIFDIGTPFDFPSGRAKIVGSYNGLLCLADIESTTTSGNVIYLWNPSIENSRGCPNLA